MGNILEIKDLSKNFKGLKAVSDVSFSVEEGKITGLIGSNGAGKTTLFNMVSGVFPPSSGQVIYKGQDITGMKPYKYTGIGIARTFQIMKPLAHMTVLENVASGAMYGRKKCPNLKAAQEYAEEILDLTGLYEKKTGCQATWEHHLKRDWKWQEHWQRIRTYCCLMRLWQD